MALSASVAPPFPRGKFFRVSRVDDATLRGNPGGNDARVSLSGAKRITSDPGLCLWTRYNFKLCRGSCSCGAARDLADFRVSLVETADWNFWALRQAAGKLRCRSLSNTAERVLRELCTFQLASADLRLKTDRTRGGNSPGCLDSPCNPFVFASAETFQTVFASGWAPRSVIRYPCMDRSAFVQPRVFIARPRAAMTVIIYTQ